LGYTTAYHNKQYYDYDEYLLILEEINNYKKDSKHNILNELYLHPLCDPLRLIMRSIKYIDRGFTIKFDNTDLINTFHEIKSETQIKEDLDYNLCINKCKCTDSTKNLFGGIFCKFTTCDGDYDNDDNDDYEDYDTKHKHVKIDTSSECNSIKLYHYVMDYLINILNHKITKKDLLPTLLVHRFIYIKMLFDKNIINKEEYLVYCKLYIKIMTKQKDDSYKYGLYIIFENGNVSDYKKYIDALNKQLKIKNNKTTNVSTRNNNGYYKLIHQIKFRKIIFEELVKMVWNPSNMSRWKYNYEIENDL
jgi:hypothetical protein